MVMQNMAGRIRRMGGKPEVAYGSFAPHFEQ
jgi:hypothetical protein